ARFAATSEVVASVFAIWLSGWRINLLLLRSRIPVDSPLQWKPSAPSCPSAWHSFPFPLQKAPPKHSLRSFPPCKTCRRRRTQPIPAESGDYLHFLNGFAKSLGERRGVRDKRGSYGVREAQKSSNRPERMQQRRAMMALAPRTDQ